MTGEKKEKNEGKIAMKFFAINDELLLKKKVLIRDCVRNNE